MNILKWLRPDKKVKIIQPLNRPVRFFKVLRDFDDPATNSQYITGGKYTVRAGNVRLDKKVTAWAEEGKVEIEEIE